MKKKTWGIHTFMAIPAFLLFAVFFLYPLGRGLQMSLTNWDGIGKAEFIGLGNFRSFFTDKRAMGDIRNTLLFALGSAPLLNIVGLGYALLMNGRFRGKSLARMFIYMPAIISPLIMGYIWYLLLQPGRGFLFHLLDKMGKGAWFGNWLGSFGSAMLVLILVNVWQYAGMTMVIYLAGLQGIPTDVMEAATIDGASTWQKFRYITLPLLKNTHMFVMITCMIHAFRSFDLVYTMTQGGPLNATKTMVMYVYEQAFNKNYYGRAAAGGIVLFAFMVVLTLIRFRIEKED